MRYEQIALDEMVKSGSELVIEGEGHYQNWWNQFRGPWLQSEKMTEDEIKTRADEAWECGDYKEMINLMAELICRLQSK